MVRDSEVVDGVFPGQPIRYEVEARGRFETLSRESYLDDLLTPLPDVLDSSLEAGAPRP